MSIDTLNIVSEAPTARAQEIARLVETLGLAEGRLSEAELARVVQAVGERHDLFDDLVVSDEQNRWWLLLYGAANFELKLLTWERGQVSNWHDHGGSSGAFEVARGALTEQFRGADSVSVVSRTLNAGQRSTFGPHHLHDVAFHGGPPTVSVHAYSPPLTALTFYDRTEFGFVAREVVPEEVRTPTAVAPSLGEG
jgi:hypothetical protein